MEKKIKNTEKKGNKHKGTKKEKEEKGVKTKCEGQGQKLLKNR